MKVLFNEATPAERKIFYNEEWKPSDIPSFLAESTTYREFGFDHDGSGPKDRYNQFKDMVQLEAFLKKRSPYAVYSSISYYKDPANRKGYEKAELVFDIDAKDLPIKNCCTKGEVCETCLETAKDVVLNIEQILKNELGLKNIHFIYSGRGYHIRILDEDIMNFTDTERAYILDYISGSTLPKKSAGKDPWLLSKGHTRIFKDRVKWMLKNMSLKDLEGINGIGKVTARELFEARDKIIKEIDETEGNLKAEHPFKMLEDILKEKRYTQFLEYITRLNASVLDAKVTVDVKRILRLPSSLHSKASMKCMWIKDIERFDPLRDAVPKFVRERG
ncbi:MAG: DNA primase catalytic subunit PriS [Candidatus Hydrothermarchaeales archaeon]